MNLVKWVRRHGHAVADDVVDKGLNQHSHGDLRVVDAVPRALLVRARKPDARPDAYEGVGYRLLARLTRHDDALVQARAVEADEVFGVGA